MKKTVFLLILAFYSCKEKPVPEFEYTLDNISDFSVIAYNNDVSSPNDNFPEITIAAKSKVIVKTKSALGLLPKLKSLNTDLTLEVKPDAVGKVYTINAYYKTYDYTLDNISDFSVIAYNNDVSSPNDNFPEITIAAKSKAIVKTKSALGLLPKLKSLDADLSLEVKPDAVGKVYTINAYYKTYEYTLDNISDAIVKAYNDDKNNLKSNFSEVSIAAKSKSIVKARSDNGIVPMLKSDKNWQLEYEVSSDKKSYTINSYENQIEYRLSGDCKPVTIVFNNDKGKVDTLKNIQLPYIFKIVSSTQLNLRFVVIKNNVNGTLNVDVFYKGSKIQTISSSNAFASITSMYDVKQNKATVDKQYPTEWPCGVYNGKELITGEKGGCYYINSNGNKTYVDRGFCNCD